MSGISKEDFAKWQAWYDAEPQEWKECYAEIDALPPREIDWNDPAWLAAMRAPVLREPIPEQERLDMEELARIQAMSPEERRVHAKAWLESKPDWWREGLAEAKRTDPKGTRRAAIPPSEGRDITKEEWGALLDAASDKWKRFFERARERRRAATIDDPVIQRALNAPKATEPLSPEGQRALEKYLDEKAKQ